MTLRLLVFGASGQVGSALMSMRSAALDVIAVKRVDADLTDPETCTRIIRSTSAHVVVNAAAFTSVDQAEQLPDIAMRINALAPGRMA